MGGVKICETDNVCSYEASHGIELLKVVHVPFAFWPDPVGGTEIYVEALAHELHAVGIECCVVAPSYNDPVEIDYQYNGLRVRRFKPGSANKNILRALRGGRSSVGWRSAESWIKSVLTLCTFMHIPERCRYYWCVKLSSGGCLLSLPITRQRCLVSVERCCSEVCALATACSRSRAVHAAH